MVKEEPGDRRNLLCEGRTRGQKKITPWRKNKRTEENYSVKEEPEDRRKLHCEVRTRGQKKITL